MPKLLDHLRPNREEIYKIANKYGISNIRVFGSVARGEENKNSDIDLLVKISKHQGMGFDLIRFEREVSNMLNKAKIDVISEKSVHKLLKNNILSTATSL